MENEIILKIQKLLPLEKNDLLYFLSKFETKKLNKGDFLVREGQKINYIGYVVSGSLMCFYNHKGETVIDEFSLENEFISDYVAILTGSVAQKSIICLEKTEIIYIYNDELQKLYSTSHEYEKMGRLVAEGLFLNWHEKAKSLMLDDAKERYLKLLKRRPQLTQRVPQYLIASYLNIKPETLSRIRKKISENGFFHVEA